MVATLGSVLALLAAIVVLADRGTAAPAQVKRCPWDRAAVFHSTTRLITKLRRLNISSAGQTCPKDIQWGWKQPGMLVSMR